jgi:hypothetical protein
MPLTVLIGPANVAHRRALVEELEAFMIVTTVDGREEFRRLVRTGRWAGFVLYERDDEGIPNQPLLRYCLRRAAGIPIVHVLSGASIRLPAFDRRSPHPLTHYILSEPTNSSELCSLAEFIQCSSGRPRKEMTGVTTRLRGERPHY